MKNMRKFAGVAVASMVAAVCFAGSASASTSGIMHKPGWSAVPPIHVKNGATSTYQNGFAPDQIRGAYGLSSVSEDGTGMTVAIVDAFGSPSIQQDLKTFDAQFGLTTTNLDVVNLGGHRTDRGWALETSLDVEWVHALAPGAKIMLVEAKSASLTDLLAAVDYASSHGAQTVSMSWGGSEFSGESAYDSHFNHAGVVYTASSGDNGPGVSWPAVSPNVAGVGGTTLAIKNSAWAGETAWSGSGGGVSTYEAVPSYQSALGLKDRGVPDVAWDADPNSGVAVYDSTPYKGQSGWYQVGGTSFGSPSWAALIAIVDQGASRNAYDSKSLLKALYADMQSGNYGTYFHDITSGSNGIQASPGYDFATGIGSPKADQLVPALVAQAGSGSSGTSASHGKGHKKK